MVASLLDPSGTTTPFGTRLRALRLARGLSLARAAEAGSVSKSALAHWEASRRLPPGDALLALLVALGVAKRDQAALLTIADPQRARVLLGEETRGASPSLGELLRAMRLRRGMGQERLACLVGVRQSTVARWERGDLQMAGDALSNLLDALAVSPDERLAALSLDPAQRPVEDLDERYERIALGPHALGETLWIGLEADLWWRATASDSHDRMLQTVIGHRADWYALAMRPQETGPQARRAMGIGFGPPSDVPQGVAYGIVYSTIQLRVDPTPALDRLTGWRSRLRTPGTRSRVDALRALLLSEMDEGAALRAVWAAQGIAGDDAEAHAYATRILARVHLRHRDPEGALRALEEDDHIDGLTIRALALALLGKAPPEDWMNAIRERPATRDIPMYRERLAEIERALSRSRLG